MNDPAFDEASSLQARLDELRQEHRDLDGAIEQLSTQEDRDELMVRRLKKRKLMLKDRIALLERALEPDEFA